MKLSSNHQNFSKTLCLVISTLAILLPACQPGSKNSGSTESSKPNIIFILADDLGYGDLGCYGQEKIKIPNLDKLASQGITFTQHYAGSTVCAPSRASLMTGYHTGHTVVRGNREIKPVIYQHSGIFCLLPAKLQEPKHLKTSMESHIFLQCWGKNKRLMVISHRERVQTALAKEIPDRCTMQISFTPEFASRLCNEINVVDKDSLYNPHGGGNTYELERKLG